MKTVELHGKDSCSSGKMKPKLRNQLNNPPILMPLDFYTEPKLSFSEHIGIFS